MIYDQVKYLKKESDSDCVTNLFILETIESVFYYYRMTGDSGYQVRIGTVVSIYDDLTIFKLGSCLEIVPRY